MSSLLREQYLWSLPYMLVSILVIMTAWLRMSAGKSQTARQSFATGGRLLLYAAPLAIAMWVFFPRIATPFWAVPMDTSQAQLRPQRHDESRRHQSLSMSDAVAFRVTFDGAIPAAAGSLLARAGTDALQWPHLVRSRTRASVAARATRSRSSAIPIDYEVTLEPTRQQWVFALDMPYTWSAVSEPSWARSNNWPAAPRSISASPTAPRPTRTTASRPNCHDSTGSGTRSCRKAAIPRTPSSRRDARSRRLRPGFYRSGAARNSTRKSTTTRWSHRRWAATRSIVSCSTRAEASANTMHRHSRS